MSLVLLGPQSFDYFRMLSYYHKLTNMYKILRGKLQWVNYLKFIYLHYHCAQITEHVPLIITFCLPVATDC